jgi:hypothetical protein
MFSTGLGILALATALLLSALQGWALRGQARLRRHLLAWVAGTVAVSSVLAACWNVISAPRALAVASLSPRALALNPTLLLVLYSVTAVGVAAALGAGAVHARSADEDAYDARDAWISRAVVQGVALFVVGGLGALALIVVAVVQVRR